MRTMCTPPYGGRPGVVKIGILLTDGESNRDHHLTIQEATRAKDDGIFLMAAGISDKVIVCFCIYW